MQDGLVRGKQKSRQTPLLQGDTAAPKLVRSYAIRCHPNRMSERTQGVGDVCRDLEG